MVEQVYSLDNIFGSLSDPTRRDMIRRVSKSSMSVSEIAKHYSFSFAGVAKHLDVLERAGLIRKTKRGKEQIVSLDAEALAAVNDYLSDYRLHWEQRLDALDSYIKSTNKEE